MVKVEEFPQPLAGDEAKLLSGAGTWVEGALEELQLDIASIPAALTPKGTWNALTNTPSLVSSIGNVPTLWGNQGGLGSGYTPLNTNRVYRIPITDTSKDIYLNVMGLFRPTDNSDGMEYCLHLCDFTIVNPGGDVALGRPNLDIVAPSTSVVKQQYRPMGWIIPVTTLATKAQTVTNSTVKYLYVKMDNSSLNLNNAHFAGFITENV